MTRQLSSSHRLRVWGGIASAIVALILISIQLFAYVMSDSVSVLGALIDSTLDLVFAFILFLGIKKAVEPADHEHRYGHHKLEAIISLSQSAFIVGSALFLVYESVDRLFHPMLVQEGDKTIQVMLISFLIKIGMISFQVYIVKRTRSLAIQADLLHYLGDLGLILGIIASLYVTAYTGIPYIDPLFAILIAFILGFGSYKISVDCLHVLMDRELPKDEKKMIEAVIKTHPEAYDYHDLRSRFDGTCRFIEFHLEMDPHLTLQQAHDITDQIEGQIKALFDSCEVLIHQEPKGIEDERHGF